MPHQPIRRLAIAGAAVATALAAVASTAAASSDDTSASGNTSALGTGSDLAIDLPAIPDDTDVDISFESYNFSMAGPGADAMNQLVDEFEAANPNIHVERRSPSAADLVASVQQEIVAGDPPSLAQMSFSVDLVRNQLGAPSWDSLLGEDGIAAYFDGTLTGDHAVHPNAMTLGAFEDETYLLPFVFSTPTLFINRTLFEAAGLDPDAPPTTWAEVEAAAASITEATDADGMFVQCTGEASGGWCYQSLLRSNGNVPISDDLTTLDFDGPEAIEVAEMLHGYVEAGLYPDVSDADASERFYRGELGMILTTSVYTSAILAASESNGWEMDATGMPAFGDRPVIPTNSGSGLITLATDPIEQRAAFELAAFLTSDHAYTVITSQIGYLPLRSGIVEDPDLLGPWLEEHPFLQDNLDQLDQLHPWVFPPGSNGAQITTVWMDAVNQVIYNGADAAATLAEAQATAVGLMPS